MPYLVDESTPPAGQVRQDQLLKGLPHIHVWISGQHGRALTFDRPRCRRSAEGERHLRFDRAQLDLNAVTRPQPEYRGWVQVQSLCTAHRELPSQAVASSLVIPKK